jgi:hypothetical protein
MSSTRQAPAAAHQVASGSPRSALSAQMSSRRECTGVSPSSTRRAPSWSEVFAGVT